MCMCPLCVVTIQSFVSSKAQAAPAIDDSSDAASDSDSSGDGQDFPPPAAPAELKPAAPFARTQSTGTARTFGAGFGRGVVARPSFPAAGGPVVPHSALATDSSDGSDGSDAEPETLEPPPAAVPTSSLQVEAGTSTSARTGFMTRKPSAEMEPVRKVMPASTSGQEKQQDLRNTPTEAAADAAPVALKRPGSARSMVSSALAPPAPSAPSVAPPAPDRKPVAPVPTEAPAHGAAVDDGATAAALAEAQAALKRSEVALRAKESELFEARQRALDAAAERDSLRASLSSAQEASRSNSSATASERAAAAAAAAAAAEDRAALERRCAFLERDLRDERAAKQAALEQAQREMDRAAALQRAADAAARVADARGGVDPALLADPSLDVAVQGALGALTAAHQSATRQLERAAADLAYAKAAAKDAEARAEAAEAASAAASQGESKALEEIATLRPALEVAQRVGSAAAERALGDARRRIGELERTVGALEEDLAERDDQLQAVQRQVERADEARRSAEATLESERAHMELRVAAATQEAAECRSLLERSQSAGTMLVHDELTRRLDAERAASASSRHALEELLEKLSRAEAALAERERRLMTQQHDAAAAAAVAAAENTALREAEARAAASYARAAAELAELRALVGPGGVAHVALEHAVPPHTAARSLHAASTPALRLGETGPSVAASPAVERLSAAEQDNRVLRARLEALARPARTQPALMGVGETPGYGPYGMKLHSGVVMHTPGSAVQRAAELQQRVAELREALASTTSGGR